MEAHKYLQQANDYHQIAEAHMLNLSCAVTWVNLGNITLSKISQSQKD